MKELKSKGIIPQWRIHLRGWVASDVAAVLGFTPSKDSDEFVGIGAHITEIKSKLILQSEELKVIVVSGPAGIGKTTTARVLYNQLSPGFPFNIFLENIRGSYEKPCGDNYQLKLRLQKDLLSQIFKQKDIEVRHLGVAQQMLSDKKVLVVLDEVDSLWQLEEMAKQRGWFGSESILIITTEDRKLLKTLRLGTDHIYEMKFPTSTESLQIFCQYAFGQKSPDYGFELLAWEVTWLAGNLSLGLRVMGSYLQGMSRDEWIDALARLRSSLDREIESTLRFSYNGLSDKDKALFLHIACFFGYFKVDSVKNCLEKSGLDVNHGLQVLDDKSLISIDNGFIKMHSLLQQMGRDIVKKQSLEEPGKRQFLMNTTEISELLDEDTGTGKVLGIMLDTSEGGEIQISKGAFEGMKNLQSLRVYSDILKVSPNIPAVCSGTLCIREGLNCLPDKLIVIHWNDCPLRIWPSQFSGKFRVELIMQDSKIEKLWEGIKGRIFSTFCIVLSVERLVIFLIFFFLSRYLKRIPDLSKATCLEKLDLHDCESLLELTSSIGNGCLLLKELPSSMGRLINLEELNLSDCSSLKLTHTAIEKVPSSMSTWSCLYKLDMYGCKKLKEFPNISDSIVELVSIIEWGPDLKCSWRLRSDFDVDYIFPICLSEKVLTSPISLCITGKGFKTVPDFIQGLSGLIKLDITQCREIVALPKLPGSLQSVDAHYCESLERIDSPFQNPNICLNFSNCSHLNQEARKLIQTSTCKYAILPGRKVPAHFTHRATSGSLTINLTRTPLPSSLRFKACILLSNDFDDEEGDNSLSGMSYSVRGKQNGHTVQYVSDQLHMPDIGVLYPKNLYIFEDSFSLNQDWLEAGEITFNELSFFFIVHDKFLKVKGCGVRLLEEVPHCILDRTADDDDEDERDDDGEGSEKFFHTSDCESTLVRGLEVPAHFTYQATSGSLTINVTPISLPSSFRFKACILLSEDYDDNNEECVSWLIQELFDNYEEDENSLMRVSSTSEQNGLTVSYDQTCAI
ncbi:hypothetical protein Bca52824_023374 [Brassica carinata]|uniref:ADP-ribosyl cyclase/cyclic ADP-ribose hydrolase n=1 Tax=Brassica carinata TaxID=52824 RepID=A0A8X8AVK7_BRACI|nr:hypothetical protein Bca52824_023374 [Brassica carinata]